MMASPSMLCFWTSQKLLTKSPGEATGKTQSPRSERKGSELDPELAVRQETEGGVKWKVFFMG